MDNKLRLIIAQLNFIVGDIKGNCDKIIDASVCARDELNGDIIIFPELALSGYPPEDLLLRRDFHNAIQEALTHIKQSVLGIDILLGYPEFDDNQLYNAAIVLRDGETITKYYKQCLPNYGIFDEKRYFNKGSQPAVFNIKYLPIGIGICEDLWFKEPIQKATTAGAKLLLCLNASPFDIHKIKEREKILKERASESTIPIIYAHCVGGQDELVFDGHSMVIDQNSNLTHVGPMFEEALIPVEIDLTNNLTIIPDFKKETASIESLAYKALVTGLHDYIEKNNFPGVLIGVSGGIDSAITLAIAVDAIGKERVHAVMIPSRYTSDKSFEDAKKLIANFGVKYSTISIEPTFKAFLNVLEPEFKGLPEDITEENIQARCRAIILMGMSNKFGNLVLTTGNKSELSVGYTTLYGDMAGGFAPLKDVYKTFIYKLANYRNTISNVIPEQIIQKLPSAELSFGQTDQDTLPPYDILDKILELYIEEDKGIEEIVSEGFDKDMITQVIKMVKKAEFKRNQSPVGVKITTRAFGKDRRYPITSGW